MRANENGKIIIYHGSESIIERPIFGGGKKANDYGPGFYCTEHRNLAAEWAVDDGRNGFVNSYLLDTKGLKAVNLNSEEYTILHWLTVLLQNRRFDTLGSLAYAAREYLIANFNVDLSEADIVIGYRADDSYFSFSRDFLNGTISVNQLKDAMHLGELGEQVVIKSERAFSRLQFIAAEPVDCQTWFPLRRKRDSEARRRYLSKGKAWVRGELYAPMILNEEVGADDVRLR